MPTGTRVFNQDIARTLVIGLPGVKKPINNLPGKLSAISRAWTIALARTCALL